MSENLYITEYKGNRKFIWRDKARTKLYFEGWINPRRDAHRDPSEGPASIWYYPNGLKEVEKWQVNGDSVTRPCGGPSKIWYSQQGDPMIELWYQVIDGNTMLHREGDLPAEIAYCEKTGKVERMEYRDKGFLHRDNGPARIIYKASGLRIDAYYQQGTIHRDVFPAHVETHKDEVVYKRYYKDGEEVTVPSGYDDMDQETKEFTWEML